MQQPAIRIVIVGGGTAGWLTACLIAAEHRAADVDVVLVESPDVPAIGVGEGTWPSMRLTLKKIGLREADLIRDCDASFKQGTQFFDWSEAGGRSTYCHPFSFPVDYASLNPALLWLGSGGNESFAGFVTPQARVIEAGLAPKQASTPEFAFNVNYGYHFDAAKIARLLSRHGVNRLGVRHVAANVNGVEPGPDGDIAAVLLADGQRLDGDLFVDCSGQRALLIGRHFGVGFVPVTDTLFNDAAIAVQVPRRTDDEPIASATRSTAVEAGWIWDIGLQSRRGIGYVHSAAHTDGESAMATVRGYVRRTAPWADVDKLAFRTIRFEPGFRRQPWVRNCVAVGLSAGFVEPLEASALALIEQSAAMISRQLPLSREIMTVVAKRYNDKMSYHWQRIVEFLKLHYVISRRTDSDYWRDCRDMASCPAPLRDKLCLWQQQPPWHDDAPRLDELFPSASYQYVLYGMGFRPAYPPASGAAGPEARVQAWLRANRRKTRQILSGLPTNRELVSAITALPGVA